MISSQFSDTLCVPALHLFGVSSSPFLSGCECLLGRIWSLQLLFAGKAPGPEKLGAVRFGTKEALVLMHCSWILF